jgi:hypothetical protein
MSPDQEQATRSGKSAVHDDIPGPLPFALPETDEGKEQPEPTPASRRTRPWSPGRTLRTLFVLGMSLALLATLSASMTLAALPGEVVLWDTFDRADAVTWAETDNGRRWASPTGHNAFSLVAGEGVMALHGRDRAEMATANAEAAQVAMQFDFSLDRMTRGTGLVVAAVLRKSPVGAYQARVRVGQAGRLWLSVTRTRGRTTTMIGQPVLVEGARYKPGRKMTVRAQAIRQNPTQLRIKVWPTGGTESRGWQLVRNDVGADLGGLGRVGLRAKNTQHAVRRDAIVRFDNVRVSRVPGAKRVPLTSKVASKPAVSSSKRPSKQGDKTKPVILALGTTAITRVSATVEWKLDEPASGFVKYGRTKRYGRESAHQDDYVHSAHAKLLSGLEPGTTYHYAIVSEDRAGNRKVSRDMTFQTVEAAVLPAPDSPPTPTPTPVPTAPPANTFNVPVSVDATGSTNVSSALQSFVNSVPDGSTIVFPAGATYFLGGDGIKINGRSNLVFEGKGAALWGTGCEQVDSLFAIGLGSPSSNITIRNFRLAGNNSGGGTKDSYTSGCEHQAGVTIVRSSGIEIVDVDISRTNGDCVYIGDSSTGNWADDVWFHDSTCKNTGRMGVAIVAGSNVTVERVAFDGMAIHAFDIEPNFANGGATDVTISNNTVGTYYNCECFGGAFLAINGDLDAPVRNVVVRDNLVTGGSLRTVVGTSPKAWSGGREHRDIQFLRNESVVPARGPVLKFSHVDGLTIMGNTQPLTAGALIALDDCVNVTAQ